MYLDTSALVKLYAAEEDAERQSRILDARTENVVAVSAMAWVESCAALATKGRVRALTREQRVRAEEALAGDLRDSFIVLPVSGRVLRSAGVMTSLHALRAYDAVQLATALVLRDEIDALQEADVHDPESVVDQVLMLSYDRDLHAAAVDAAIAHACPRLAGGRTFPAP